MKTLLIFGIRFYQWFLSPFLSGNQCRFSPSCSEYAKGAIEKFGSIKGTYLSIWRILRCQPFNKHAGYDPLP